LWKDRQPKNPHSEDFYSESHVLYEWSSEEARGLAIENLFVFAANNKRRTANDRKIKSVLASWKFAKEKFSPVCPEIMVKLEFPFVINRSNKKKNNDLKKKRGTLMKVLQSHTTVDLRIFT
jgi:hypothetical protein